MANDVGSSGYKYGSVNNDEESGATTDGKSFDESNLYFMKDEELSKKEKAVKVFKLAVPIIIAVLLIGGLAFLMFHNFAHFYPGRGGKHSHSMSSGATAWSNDDDGTSGASISAPWSKDDDGTSRVFIPAPSTSTSGGSSCSANPKCADLGLTGQCCPSASGDQLSCCS